MAQNNIDNLSLEEVISRAFWAYPQDAWPLFKYLKFEDANEPTPDVTSADIDPENAQDIGNRLALEIKKMGSNDFATMLRGGEPVKYAEVVYDVGKKLKANVLESSPVFKNEAAILEKVFTSILEEMNEDERREIVRNLDLGNQGDINYGSASTMATQILGNMLGFTTYKVAMIVANFIAKALLGRGLAFATNAAITRSIGAFLGPVGWIATGAWLAIDLAGPAYRKTVPSVIHVALLRSMLKYRVTIGVVGDGSTGKDALLKSVFDIDTQNISPIAGATHTFQEYQMNNKGVFLINYPGFNDTRNEVRHEVSSMIHQTDLFIMVSDISRGISNIDKVILNKLSTYNCPVLVCVNKVDLPRPSDLKVLKERAIKELDRSDNIIFTSFDPDPRLGGEICGVKKTRKWIIDNLDELGKSSENIPR